jgi:hypothetical protein
MLLLVQGSTIIVWSGEHAYFKLFLIEEGGVKGNKRFVKYRWQEIFRALDAGLG